MSAFLRDGGEGPGTPEEVLDEAFGCDSDGRWRAGPEGVAVALFEAGFSCAEATVFTLATHFNAGVADPQPLGAGLGGGVGRLGHVCGCLSGLAVAAGAIAGRTSCDDEERKERVYEAVCRVADRIEKDHGSVHCRTLTGLDFSITADRDEFHRRVQREVCIPLLTLTVRAAVEELAELRPRGNAAAAGGSDST